MNAASLRAEAAKRILIKDGAYGTSIQEHRSSRGRLSRRSRSSRRTSAATTICLISPSPELVRVDLRRSSPRPARKSSRPTPSTPMRSARPITARSSWSREINRAAAQITRGVADRYSAGRQPRWVAGALGPTNKTLSLSPNVNDPAFREVDFDQVKAVYREQIDALVEGGVDFILIETIFDTLNAKAAIMATLEAEQALGRELPLMISMTLTDLQRPQSFGPYGRGFLGLGPPRQADDRSGSTAPSARRSCGRISRRLRRSPTRWSWPIRTPAFPTNSANMTRRRSRPPPRSANGARAVWSTSSAAAAGRLPRTSPRLPGRCAIARRAPSRPLAPATLLAGLEPMVIAA